MVEIAIDKGIFRDPASSGIVENFFSERGIDLQSYRLPNDIYINSGTYPMYNFPDIKIAED